MSSISTAGSQAGGSPRVAVVGGGTAGAMAAYRLIARRSSPTNRIVVPAMSAE